MMLSFSLAVRLNFSSSIIKHNSIAWQLLKNILCYLSISRLIGLEVDKEALFIQVFGPAHMLVTHGCWIPLCQTLNPSSGNLGFLLIF